MSTRCIACNKELDFNIDDEFCIECLYLIYCDLKNINNDENKTIGGDSVFTI